VKSVKEDVCVSFIILLEDPALFTVKLYCFQVKNQAFMLPYNFKFKQLKCEDLLTDNLDIQVISTSYFNTKFKVVHF